MSSKLVAMPISGVRGDNAPGSGQWWMVAILLFALLPEGLTLAVSGRTPRILLFDLVIALVLGLLAWEFFLGKTHGRFDPHVTFLAVVFTSSHSLSLLFNFADVPRGLLAIKVFVFAYACYLIALRVLKSSADLKYVILALLWWGGVVGCLLGYRFITDWAAVLGPEASYAVKDEVGISMGRSNYLAAMLVPVLPLGVSIVIDSRGFFRVAAAIPVALMILGLLITMSKGALLSLLIGLFCGIPFFRKLGVKFKHVLLFLLVTTVVLLLMPKTILVANAAMIAFRIQNPEMSRPELWAESWRQFLEHPILGIGPNAMHIYNERAGLGSLDTHNFALQILAELGILGAIPFFGILAIMIGRSYRILSLPLSDRHLQRIALGLHIGLLATLAHGLVEPTFPGQQYAVVFWVFVSLITFIKGCPTFLQPLQPGRKF